MAAFDPKQTFVMRACQVFLAPKTGTKQVPRV